MQSLKSKAIRGVLWAAIDKFAIQVGSFVISIILARLLLPSDYGMLGMLSIFIAVSNTFINSGMGSGLIQKQERTNADFSTVFIFNLAVSLVFYIVLYITAPYIANFYNTPMLVPLTRVVSLTLIINSFAIVQRTRLIIKVDFKSLAKVNAVSVIISGLIAIYFAFKGLGVWALVIQTITQSIIAVIILWIINRWKPQLVFSKKSFKDLFGFGSKLLLAGLYATSLNEAYNIAIGKKYSSSDLGYYDRAKSYADMSAGTVTSILQQVTYPILASLQNERERMISIYSRLIRMTAFFIIPAMTLLSLLAKPFVSVLLGENWLSVVVLLQWIAFARIVTPISAVNMNILNAVGRSDLFLKVDLAKFPIIVLVMIITIPIGVKAIVIGYVITSLISFFINAYMPGKLFGYGAFSQLRDITPMIIATGIMAIFVYIVGLILRSDILHLIFGGIVGLITYGGVAFLLKIDEVKEVKDLFKQIINKK